LVVEKVHRLANKTKQISKDCLNKCLVGRIAWERVAKPSLLYGLEAAELTKTCIKKVQTIQNQLGRFLTGTTKQSRTEGVSGELGWWRIQDTIAMKLLCYARRPEFLPNDRWARMVWEASIEGSPSKQTRWQLKVQSTAQEYGVKLDQAVQSFDQWKRYVNLTITNQVQRLWKTRMENKPELTLYSDRGKLTCPGYWDGSKEASALCRLRIGNIQQHGGQTNRCIMCSTGPLETSTHILLECPAYHNLRVPLETLLGKDAGELTQMDNNEKTQLLLGIIGTPKRDHWRKVIPYIGKFWNVRQDIMHIG
jgi:hypothetical protein